MQGASPDEAHPWLHAKPLDATIGRVPASYCPGGHHGRQFRKEKKHTTKTQLLPSFLTVDQHKKAINSQDPKVPSTHVFGATSPNPNPYATSQVEELSYIFDLSKVANGQKFEKLISLNEARENLWRIYAPVAVILLSSYNVSPNIF
jgi:hypothetical protein